MAFTFEPEKLTALARARLLVDDTDSTDALYDDAQWEAYLRLSADFDFLWIYLDDTAAVNSGITAATVEVRNGTTEVELELVRTGTGGTTDTFPLSVSTQYDQVWELLKGIDDLDLGWRVDLSLGRGLDPEAESAPRTWDDRWAREADEDHALRRRSSDLALTPTPLDVFGQAKRKRLLAYDVKAAALRALQTKLLALRDPDDYTEGDIRCRWTIEGVRAKVGALRSRVNVFAVDAIP